MYTSPVAPGHNVHGLITGPAGALSLRALASAIARATARADAPGRRTIRSSLRREPALTKFGLGG